MKFWTKLLVPVLALSLVGVAHAAKGDKKAADAPKAARPAKGDKAAKAAKRDGVRGRIVSVSAGSIVIKTGGKKDAAAGADVTIQTNDDTSVTIDGAAGKVSDLKPGQVVVVSPATGTAKVIKATGGRGKGKPGEAAKPKREKKPAA